MKTNHNDVHKAISAILEKENVVFWLNEPNDYLNGKTPNTCLEEGKFDNIINALWMVSGIGPVS